MITKEQFADYRACQGLGAYNMLDYASYAVSGLTNLTEEQWFEIIKNYSKYLEEYGEDA